MRCLSPVFGSFLSNTVDVYGVHDSTQEIRETDFMEDLKMPAPMVNRGARSSFIINFLNTAVQERTSKQAAGKTSESP